MSVRGYTVQEKISTGMESPVLIAVPDILIADIPVGASSNTDGFSRFSETCLNVCIVIW